MPNGNFTDHLAPNLVHGRERKGPDQIALETKQRMKERDEAYNPLSVLQAEPYDYDADRKDREIVDRFQRRGLRGGSTFEPSDLI